MGNAFAAALSVNIPGSMIKTIGNENGLDYAPWAAMVQLAGRPKQSVVFFEGKPGRIIFGGLAVAVDMDGQRTYLPLLDFENNPRLADKASPRIVNDGINRCRAKAIAMVTGYGLSLYAGHHGEGAAFLVELGGEGDLIGTDPEVAATIKPVITRRAAEDGTVGYIDWASALAVARLTDPAYRWNVLEFDVADVEGALVQQPYLPVSGGYFVGVQICWRGHEHTELLPIMDDDHNGMKKPTVADWNRAVMRCHTKAIAVVTGYGLSLYAGEDLEVPAADGSVEAQSVTHANRLAAQEAHAGLVKEVHALLVEKKRTVAQMVLWMGEPGKTIEDLPVEQLERALKALKAPTRATA
jgi:hypothetical protein